MPQPDLPSRLRFDSFELDLRTRELRKNGRTVRLQDQPAKLLALLVSRAGELVTRAEIEKALWGDDEFVEFEHAINTAIRKIREALGDPLERPRFIETLPRKGYRFIASVDGHFPAEAASLSEPEQPKSDIDPMPESDSSSDKPLPGFEEELRRPASSAAEFALPRSSARLLFLATQIGYLAIYSAVLYKAEAAGEVLTTVLAISVPFFYPLVLVLAMCGIAVRMYLITSVGLNHPAAGQKYRQIFPALFLFDILWATSPLLLIRKIGFGLALGSIAALAYLPFAQRILMQNIYPGSGPDNPAVSRISSE